MIFLKNTRTKGNIPTKHTKTKNSENSKSHVNMASNEKFRNQTTVKIEKY